MSTAAQPNVVADKTKYINAANQTYQFLKATFPGSDFWYCGHAFDTVVDYFLTVNGSDANVFAATAIQEYKPFNNAWYDDFSWWGIAFLKAATAPVFSSANRDSFRRHAFEAWLGMGPSPFGWALCNDEALRKKYAPRFGGGVWNHILDEADNPGIKPFAGHQNTVTNLGYLVLASRLFLDKGPNHDVFQAAMETEYGFMEEWLKLPDAKYCLLHHFGNPLQTPKMVVRERVGIFQSGEEDPQYNPNCFWAGDQGLLLGALVDRMTVIGPERKDEYDKLLGWAISLLHGSREYFAPNHILQPWHPNPPTQPQPIKQDTNDYWTGRAVYMRYLLWAFQHNARLKTFLRGQGFQNLLSINADEVVKDPNRPQSGIPIVDLTNNLAILVAAIAMLP
jgi:hypothetical protein